MDSMDLIMPICCLWVANVEGRSSCRITERKICTSREKNTDLKWQTWNPRCMHEGIVFVFYRSVFISNLRNQIQTLKVRRCCLFVLQQKDLVEWVFTTVHNQKKMICLMQISWNSMHQCLMHTSWTHRRHRRSHTAHRREWPLLLNPWNHMTFSFDSENWNQLSIIKLWLNHHKQWIRIVNMLHKLFFKNGLKHCKMLGRTNPCSYSFFSIPNSTHSPQPPQGCSTSCPSAPKLAVESVPNLTKWQSNSSVSECQPNILNICHQWLTFLWVRLVQSHFFSRPGREPLPPCPGKNMLFTFSRPPWLPRNCEKRDLSASTQKCWNNRTHWILTAPLFQLQWCNVCPKNNRFSACLMDKIWQNAMLMQCCVPQLQYQLRLTGFAASGMLWCQKKIESARHCVVTHAFMKKNSLCGKCFFGIFKIA